MKNLISTLFIFCLINCTLIAQNTISGEVICRNGGLLANVTVELTGGTIGIMTVVTDNTGTYTFNDVPANEDYNIHLEKDGNSLSGVSTYDLVLMHKYILNISNDGPLFFLASDINNSGSVTILDILILREIILGSGGPWPIGPWRFATDDYDNTTASGYVDDVPVVNLQENLTINFVGVYVGDVNGGSVDTDCN